MLGTVAGLGAVCAGAVNTAGPDAGLALQSAGVVLGQALSVIGNVFASDFQRHLATRVTDPSAALRNSDLNRLVAETIELVLQEFAEGRVDRDAFRALAASARERWPRVCAYPGVARLRQEDLQGILEQDLTDLLANSPRDPSQATALDRRTWTRLLAYFARHTRAQLGFTAKSVSAAARHLAMRFAWAFREKAKLDFENGGRAYAALHLMALGELLATSRQTAAQVAQIADALPRMEMAIAGASAGLIQQMDEDAQRRHSELLEGVTSLFANVKTLRESIDGVQLALETLRSERALTLDELRQTLRQSLEFVSRLQVPKPVSWLELDHREPFEVEAKNLFARLLPRNRAIPFIGRARELRTLESWLVSVPIVGIQVVYGDAGQGKTRLAQELCDRARAMGWDAGFAGQEALAAMLQSGAIHWNWDRPTLVVIDYSSGRAEQLERVVKGLAERLAALESRPQVRLLLLDRHSGEGMTWWERVLGEVASDGGVTVGRWYSPSTDLELRPLGESSRVDELELMAVAVNALVEVEPSRQKKLEQVRTRLQAAGLTSSPLLVQLAAIYYVSGANEVPQSREDLLRELLKRDSERVLRPLFGVRPSDELITLTRRLMMFVTLVGGHTLDVPTLRAMVGAEAQELGCDAPAPADLRRVLRDYLGVHDGRLTPLGPDLIAEFLLLTLLVDPSPARTTPEFLRFALQRNARSAGEYLLRAAQDFTELLPLLGDDAVVAMNDALPWEMSEYSLVALAIAERLLSKSRDGLNAAESPEAIDNYESALFHFAVRSESVGRDDDAERTLRESIEICRKLSSDGSTLHRVKLIDRLQRLGAIQAKLEDHAGAVASFEEAQAEAARVEGEPGWPTDLFEARLLDSLSDALWWAGQRERAIRTAVQALTHCTQLPTNVLFELQARKLVRNVTRGLGALAPDERTLSCSRDAIRVVLSARSELRRLLHEDVEALLAQYERQLVFVCPGPGDALLAEARRYVSSR